MHLLILLLNGGEILLNLVIFRIWFGFKIRHYRRIVSFEDVELSLQVIGHFLILKHFLGAVLCNSFELIDFFFFLGKLIVQVCDAAFLRRVDLIVVATFTLSFTEPKVAAVKIEGILHIGAYMLVSLAGILLEYLFFHCIVNFARKERFR